MENKNPIEDLKEIRSIMEKSTKFISLSGLSGVFAGLTALVGAWLAAGVVKTFEKKIYFYSMQNKLSEGYAVLEKQLILLAGGILVVALGFGLLFTWLKARKSNQKLMTPMGFRLALAIGVPLLFSGLFCIGLYLNGIFLLIPSAMLVMYGMSILNGSKYVHNEIKYLAVSEMILGVVAMFYLEYSLYFWAFGFGVLHIFYGAIMYFKYDYKK